MRALQPCVVVVKKPLPLPRGGMYEEVNGCSDGSPGIENAQVLIHVWLTRARTRYRTRVAYSM